MADWSGTEADRRAALDRYDLDAGAFEALQEISVFAAELCRTPIGLVSMVEEMKQTFIACSGLSVGGTDRDVSFCAHAMLTDGIFMVTDAANDPRFTDNALVTGDPNIRFYAGVPLTTLDGIPLGALAVIDREPRPEGLTDFQARGLKLLGQDVMFRLEARRRSRDVAIRELSAAKALSHSESRFLVLADSMPQMVWSALPDGYCDYFNALWYDFTGTAAGATDGDAWSAVFHPEDQDRAWERWRHSLATGEPYEIEYRMRHYSGLYRWTLGRAMPMRDDDGAIVRWFGTCTDIHEQKLMIEERELIAHELSHRIKNIFSVISGLVGLSARERPEISGVAEELRDRVMALGRAHDYVRPHSARSASDIGQNSLRGVLGEIFAPYRRGDDLRIEIVGDDIAVDDRSATPLALLFHELATNAAKHGALSTAEGSITLTLDSEGEDCLLRWQERGGPPVVAEHGEGFGTRLMALSVERQLGGRIVRDWRSDGLVVSLAIPRRAMSRAKTA